MTAAKRLVCLAAAAAMVAALPWLHGQAPPPRSRSIYGQIHQDLAARPQIAPAASSPGRRQFDLARMSPLQQQFYLSAQRGADWLLRRQKPDGRFIYGFSPSLNLPLEEDSYLAQIEAAFALARSARFFRNEEAGMRARQALMTLLLNTMIDPQNKSCRCTIPPSNFVNRPAAAGLLILAISELPTPPEIGKDLLDQAGELANYLQRQIRPDGSVALIDSPEDVESFSGRALLGIVRSQQFQPAPWKLEALRKALVHYQACWRQHKNAVMLAEHSAAFTEAFLLSRDRTFAEFVFEMNDWLLTYQYQNMDPARQLWTGGFQPWIDGKAVLLPPDVRSAVAAESLANACRAAKVLDLGRFGRYKEDLETCLRFLTTMQYNEANTQHFADQYRQMLVGGFHASRSDGNLRIDYTQHAVNAFVQYLEHVAELP